MKPLDFEYDGSFLSDFGFVVCDFNAGNSISDVSAGSNISFMKIPRQHGIKHGLVHTEYHECITSTFDICKNPELHDDMEISDDEFRAIMRWLNRKEFLPFHFIPEEDAVGDAEICYHNASFNLSKLMLDEKLFGIRLKVETDMPYGYGEECVFSWTTTAQDKTKVVMDTSDEIGYTYPTLIITCKENCDLTITNKSMNCVSQIKNCKIGEIITMYGDTNIITTSYDSHDICNDFNYEFFCIGNDYSQRENIITTSHECDVVLKYSPIIKCAQL